MPLLAPVITTTLSSIFDVSILLFLLLKIRVLPSPVRAPVGRDVPVDVWPGRKFRYLVVVSDYDAN
jgi:hypothetical protein